MTKSLLIFGATSAIAEQVAITAAKQDITLFLVGRNAEKLQAIESHLQLAHDATVQSAIADLNETAQFPQLLKQAQDALGTIDMVLIAQGTLPDEERCRTDNTYATEEWHTNFHAPALLLNTTANVLRSQNSPVVLAVIGSPAGLRGRSSNHFYGAAKAGLMTFAQGLRARLSTTNVHVLTIIPGFIATPMTAHMKQGPLFASPQTAAKDILRAMKKRKNMIYTPWFWRWIMLIIRLIPERIFKKLSI